MKPELPTIVVGTIGHHTCGGAASIARSLAHLANVVLLVDAAVNLPEIMQITCADRVPELRREDFNTVSPGELAQRRFTANQHTARSKSQLRGARR